LKTQKFGHTNWKLASRHIIRDIKSVYVNLIQQIAIEYIYADLKYSFIAKQQNNTAILNRIFLYQKIQRRFSAIFAVVMPKH
jgi:hypothetical protein